MMIKEHKERKLIENTFNTENNIFFYIIVSVLRLCFLLSFQTNVLLWLVMLSFLKKVLFFHDKD